MKGRVVEALLEDIIDRDALIGALYDLLREHGLVSGKAWCQIVALAELFQVVEDADLGPKYLAQVEDWLNNDWPASERPDISFLRSA